MKPEARYRRQDGVAKREIAGETFLIPICGTPVDMNDIFVMNPLGDFIWQRLDGERKLEAIIGEIAAEFDVSRDQAGDDAQDFIGRLLQNNLVEALP